MGDLNLFNSVHVWHVVPTVRSKLNSDVLPSLQSFPWNPVWEQSHVGSLLIKLQTPPFKHMLAVPQRSFKTPSLSIISDSVLLTFMSVIHPGKGSWSLTTADVSRNATDRNSGGIPPTNKWLKTVISRLLDFTSTHFVSPSTIRVVFLKFLLIVTACHWLSLTAVSDTTVAGSAQKIEKRRLSLPFCMRSSRKSQNPSSSKYTSSPWELFVFMLKLISLSQHAFHTGNRAHCPSAPVNSRQVPISTKQQMSSPTHMIWAPCGFCKTIVWSQVLCGWIGTYRAEFSYKKLWWSKKDFKREDWHITDCLQG